ncbi:MAG: FAD-dependent oxidoreductase [Burkholderiales bacterium]|nr:FAD-dependent oxidoreductase [Burkholderiales bacterium]
MSAEGEVVCDVLVIGSGAGGLAAAVTARHHGLDVIVAEKAPVFGGTTARSGGWVWIPCHPLQASIGVVDSRAEAEDYLLHEAGAHFDAERVGAFLAAGPRMVEFFTRETAVRFVPSATFSDYHPDAPGGKPGGRAMVAEAFDGRALGRLLARLRPPLPELTMLGMMIGSGQELAHFMRATKSLGSALYTARLLGGLAVDLLLHGRSVRLTNGNALAGRLLKSAADLGVDLWESATARELVVEDGAVRGAVVERARRAARVGARRGVVLACGGFPHDVARRKRLFPHAGHLSPAPESNTGDGLRMAEAVGARIDEALPEAAAWVPVSRVPRSDGTVGLFPHFVDRAKPGVIAVTRRGARFVNEADSYHDFVRALRRACEGEPEIAAWLVTDHRAVRAYGLGFAKPFPLPLGPHVRSGYVARGRTLAELAARAGIDGAALAATVAEYNHHAERGEDPHFGKGGTAYNRFYGDVDIKPNPCLAPIVRPPFYAVKVTIGDLGTYAGLATDRHARVLNARGTPIPGLYAAGNDMASIMGGAYPGPGITLGPAMTFGWIAGRHLAGVAAE